MQKGEISPNREVFVQRIGGEQPVRGQEFWYWCKDNPAVIAFITGVLIITGLLFDSIQSADNHVFTLSRNVTTLSQNTNDNFTEVRQSIDQIKDDVSEIQRDLGEIEGRLSSEEDRQYAAASDSAED